MGKAARLVLVGISARSRKARADSLGPVLQTTGAQSTKALLFAMFGARSHSNAPSWGVERESLAGGQTSGAGGLSMADQMPVGWRPVVPAESLVLGFAQTPDREQGFEWKNPGYHSLAGVTPKPTAGASVLPLPMRREVRSCLGDALPGLIAWLGQVSRLLKHSR